MIRQAILSALAAATMLAPVAASAQGYGEVRRDQRELRQEQRELRQAQRFGDRGDVREQREDVRDARRERNEDWRDYRRSHGDVFRGARYVAPQRGWTYRTLTPGYRLAPSFYGSRYVIADPYRYRLPASSRFTRWVRYGQDVVLVDVRSGRVQRVFDRFFY